MNKAIRFLFFGFLVFSIAVIGCKDNNSTGPNVPPPSIPSALQGIWEYQAVTVDGVEFDLAYALEWQDNTDYAQFTVGATGSFTYREYDVNDSVLWVESGTISVDDTTATITLTNDSDGPINPAEELSGAWHLEGDILSVSGDVDGYAVVFYTIRVH